jgi:hypothetical protein
MEHAEEQIFSGKTKLLVGQLVFLKTRTTITSSRHRRLEAAAE